MSRTEDFLWEAFAGESQANRKYSAFAAQADKEGHPQAARLFRAAAEAEAVHAANHLRALKGIKGTKENLREAIAGETHEFKYMYPEMIAAAKEEGASDAERSFNYANAVEEHHARLYHNMLDGLDSQRELFPYYVCPVCGMTVEREAPDKCPVCGVKGSMFKRVE
ncbi:rubrerythrin family protein [Methanothrix sp.]|uniref:rubrerythrin family protein n=1 Tax=Methanothrix sp. TaxID=90426 RepID=UPI001BD5EA38